MASERIMALRCPSLVPAASPATDAAPVFDRVLAAVTGFCPRVEAVGPGVCAFGIRGPARYFGGETALAARVIAAVADLGVQGFAGVADGLFAALLAARAAEETTQTEEKAETGWTVQTRETGEMRRTMVVPPGGTPGFLAPQPVTVLVGQFPAGASGVSRAGVSGETPRRAGVSGAGASRAGASLIGPDLVRLLKRLGLSTLGDLAALPVGDVASRFGEPGELAHRLARGLDPRPLRPAPPPRDLSVTLEFGPPEPRAEPVVFAARALAERMHDGLAARGLTCVRVQVLLTWADGRQSSRRWRHDGTLTAAGLADRVRWQLDGEPARPGPAAPGPAGQDGDGGITTLQLVPDQVVRATGHQLTLWGEAAVSDRVARAAMRVQAMLGHEAVLRPAPGGGRNAPERVTAVPFGEMREPRLPGGRPWPGRIPGPAPAVVYPAGREAEVTDGAGRRVTVSGRCVISAAPARLAVGGGPPRRVVGWAGPWPLSERWWDPAAARRRARFQLVTDDGRAWLAVLADGRWLVEARY